MFYSLCPFVSCSDSARTDCKLVRSDEYFSSNTKNSQTLLGFGSGPIQDFMGTWKYIPPTLKFNRTSQVLQTILNYRLTNPWASSLVVASGRAGLRHRPTRPWTRARRFRGPVQSKVKKLCYIFAPNDSITGMGPTKYFGPRAPQSLTPTLAPGTPWAWQFCTPVNGPLAVLVVTIVLLSLVQSVRSTKRCNCVVGIYLC